MFVSAATLEEFTRKRRPSAQARFLKLRYPKIVFTVRDDGTIALRQDELDRHTLSKMPPARQRRRLDLSYLNGNG